jgi:hypothetical protein
MSSFMCLQDEFFKKRDLSSKMTHDGRKFYRDEYVEWLEKQLYHSRCLQQQPAESEYAVALRVYGEFCDDGYDAVRFYWWLQQRLTAASAPDKTDKNEHSVALRVYREFLNSPEYKKWGWTFIEYADEERRLTAAKENK